VGTGYEYSVNGGTYQSSPIFTELATGTYTVKAKLSGCEGASTSEIINAQPLSLTISGAISGNATPLLGGSETYSIPAVAGAISYIWSLPNGSWLGTSTSSTIIATPAAMVDNTGVISVKSVSADGCQSDPVTFTVAIKPAVPAVVSPVAFCQNGAVSALTATADAGGTLNWYTTATGGTSSSTAPTPSITTAGSTSYFVSQTVNGVESARSEIVIEVEAIPAQPAAITGAAYVLSGSSQDYSVTAVSGVSSYVWTLPSGTSGASSTNTIRANFGTTAGTISVKALSAAGCESPPQTVTVAIKPAAPTVSPVAYCQFATASALTATATGTLNWYTAAT
jgi:hypothetical protein